MARVLTLSAFVRSARPFSWGECDCLLFLADWVRARHGVDPAWPYRGRYSGSKEAQAIVAQAGGMIALVADCVAPMGIARTETPEPGDIAVVAAPEGETGAIVMSGGRSASISVRGFMVRRLPILAAWRI